MSLKNCPCGKKDSFTNCCKKAHNNIYFVKTAEDLMRSRYSAFAMNNIDYLLKSWSTKTVNTSVQAKKELAQWTPSVSWFKLDVINSNLGQENDTTGTVEFKAFFYENGKLECIHENSFFERENGHWVYVKEV